MIKNTIKPYASSKFVTNISDLEATEPNSINAKANQVISDNNFNSIFSPINVDNSTTAELNVTSKLFRSQYEYGIKTVQPSSTIPANNAHIGCKTAPEYTTTDPVNMPRIDNAYHTFNTCSNKATSQGYKYFSIVSPLPSAGITDPTLFECHAGNDPLSNSNSAVNYYDYVTLWTMGPTVNTFGVSVDTGDIIITADNIANMGVNQNKYNTTTTTYEYGNKTTFVPKTFDSLKTYVFDITQVSVTTAYLNGGWVGKQIPISQIGLLDGTNDTYILGAQDGPYMKMVSLQFAIGDSSVNPLLPNDKSLYVKAVEARYTGGGRFVRITAPCFGDNWLQISELQVFDTNGVNVAKGKKVTSSGTWQDWRVNPMNITSGNANLKPYWAGHHSSSPCNGWILIDLGVDVNIQKIVYYNRRDCCRQRIAGSLLQVFSSTGAELYKSVMSKDDVQTYNVITPTQLALTAGPATSTSLSAINNLWKSAVPCNLVTDATSLGYAIQGLTVSVSPYGVEKGVTGYTANNNSQLSNTKTASLYTLTGVEPGICQAKCDTDNNCLGYTTTPSYNVIQELDPVDLGCYVDGGNRAMTTYNGNGKSKNDCISIARQRNQLYAGIQYDGQCWTTNDDSANTGYAKYGKDNKQPCRDTGGVWQNRVYKRTVKNVSVTDCNFYGKNIDGKTQPANGSNISIRNKIDAPVNNTSLNLTNNALKIDLTKCEKNACILRLELGTDGNIKLFRTMKGNETNNSTTGEVIWDLFSSDNTVLDKVKQISPITQLEWKNALNNGNTNILSMGETIPSTKKQLISPNAQFKLEINGGYLQLKAAVYGCFSTDSTYSNVSAPMYTNAVQNGPQSFYVYQTDLSHPKIGNTYYSVSGPKGVGLKQIDNNNPILINSNSYHTIDKNSYQPYNDVDSTNVSSGSLSDCQNKCNSVPGCNYFYLQNDKQCLLGNQNMPAYVPNSSNSTNKYSLNIRKKQLDTTSIASSISDLKTFQPEVKQISFSKLNEENTALGPAVNTAKDIGPNATPPGKSIIYRSEQIRVGPGLGKPSTPATPISPAISTLPSLPALSPPPKGIDNTQSTYSIVKSSILSEGFDSHQWKDPTANCGNPGFPACQPGILYGQIKPLQEIANDYGKQLNIINKNYVDLSNNIGKYNSLYSILNNDSQYDFSGNQPIILNGNTDLNTEMKNDAKQLALQANNMYIAGSILTGTLLLSAIYLGRS